MRVDLLWHSHECATKLTLQRCKLSGMTSNTFNIAIHVLLAMKNLG